MNTPRNQQGVTMLVVMVLLGVMLLGALALARMTEVSTLAAGNSTFRDTALQASDIGLNTAFAQVRAIPTATENDNVAGWYWAQTQAQDANGLPLVSWDDTPEIVVGAYSVRYVAERVCTLSAVTDPLRECLVKQVKVNGSNIDSDDKLDPPNSKQFRVTVRVTGPKDTTTFTQSLLTKG